MATYNITSNLLNTTSRNLWVIARSTSTATCPAWLVWVLVAMLVGLVLFGIWCYWDLWVR